MQTAVASHSLWPRESVSTELLHPPLCSQLMYLGHDATLSHTRETSFAVLNKSFTLGAFCVFMDDVTPRESRVRPVTISDHNQHSWCHSFMTVSASTHQTSNRHGHAAHAIFSWSIRSLHQYKSIPALTIGEVDRYLSTLKCHGETKVTLQEGGSYNLVHVHTCEPSQR